MSWLPSDAHDYGGPNLQGNGDSASLGGAGIGARGDRGSSDTDLGTISIYGGIVSAEGGYVSGTGAAGIGGSWSANSGGRISISGGSVTTTAYAGAAAIGGGQNNRVESITISGGSVTATAVSMSVSSVAVAGAAIGCGAVVEEINKRSFGEISITGGRVTAEGNIGYGINFPGSAGNSGGSVTIGDNAEVSFSGDILAETIIWNRTLSFDLGSGSSVTVTANEEGKAVENSQAE